MQTGLTQEEAATRLAKSPHTYAKWEQGKTVPASLADIIKICDLFNISMDWLVRGKTYGSADVAQLKTDILEALDAVLEKHR